MNAERLKMPTMCEVRTQRGLGYLFADLRRAFGRNKWQPLPLDAPICATLERIKIADEAVVLHVLKYLYQIVPGNDGSFRRSQTQVAQFLGICGLRGVRYAIPTGGILSSAETYDQVSAPYFAAISVFGGRQKGIPSTLDEMLAIAEKAGRKTLSKLMDSIY
jgi:hypothetical protein